MVKTQVLQEWIENNPSVHKWTKRLGNTKTRIDNARSLYRFIKFLEQQGGFKWTDKQGNEHITITPGELLDAQDELQVQGRRQRYKLLEVIQEWINSNTGRFNTKKQRYSSIRSFFLHNRVPLPDDKSFSLKGDEPPVQGLLKIEDLQKLILSSNEAYQTIFLIMFQSGMGGNEFDYFNTNSWKQIKPQLETEKHFIRIDLPGRKHSRHKKPYYTFIGKDAIDALKRYLRIRGQIKNDEAIFINKNGTLITKGTVRRYFRRHANRLGIIKYETPDCPECGGETKKRIVSTAMKHYRKTGSLTRYTCIECGHIFPTNKKIIEQLKGARYGASPHELRDLFRSCWETSPAKGIVAEFFMGHAIDPNNYNRFYEKNPKWTEGQYRLAMPWLNIISEDPRKIPIDEVTKITEKTKEQNGKIQELEQLIQKRDEEIEVLKQQFAAKEQESDSTKQDIADLRRQFEEIKKLVMEKKD